VASAARFVSCMYPPFLGVLSEEDVRLCHDLVFLVKGKKTFCRALTNSILRAASISASEKSLKEIHFTEAATAARNSSALKPNGPGLDL
jgi:hypothetical protein